MGRRFDPDRAHNRLGNEILFSEYSRISAVITHLICLIGLDKFELNCISLDLFRF